MKELKHIVNIKRRYFIPEALLSLYLLIITLGGEGHSRYATILGLMAVVLLGLEIFCRSEIGQFLHSLRPVFPFFCFMLLSLAVLKLIPYTGQRVWNNFTGLITIVSIFYIVRRIGEAPLLEFIPVLMIYGICVTYIFFPSMLTIESAEGQRMRVGIEALGHKGTGMGASQISLIVGIGSLFGIFLLIKYHLLKVPFFKSLFKSIILFGLLMGAYAVVRYSGSRQGVLWIALVLMTYLSLKNSSNLFFAASISLIGVMIFFSILMLYFKDLAVVDRVTIFFDPLRQLEVEKSFYGRKDMVAMGINWWLQSPIWGNGNEAFRVFNYGTYSHNNYIELLVNYGLLGLMFYYTPLLICLFGSLRFIKHHDEAIRLPFLWIFQSVFCILVSNIFLPAYYMRPMLFFYSYLVGYYAYLKYTLQAHRSLMPHTRHSNPHSPSYFVNRKKAFTHV